jgi:hypothetical protein
MKTKTGKKLAPGFAAPPVLPTPPGARATGRPRSEVFPESAAVCFPTVVEAKPTSRRKAGGRIALPAPERDGRRVPAGEVKRWS